MNMRFALAGWVASALFAAATAYQAAADEPAADKTAKAPAADEKAFVPPDGWREKKRGKFTVYCRKEMVVGSRFQKETCYDQEGIRAMLEKQQQDRDNLDQMRRICGQDGGCAR